MDRKGIEEMADIIVDEEFLASQMGDRAKEFIECMRIVQDIIDNPDHYVGMQAIKYANVLAAYRTQMIVKSQAFKRRSTIMSEQDKLVNDIWKTMNEALTENINALKISGRGTYN
jgi:hypothetical protein